MKPVRLARRYTFDGFKLGAIYGTDVMARPPYSEPCDNDPIDRKARRFMVYGATPCRGRAFPEATTVVFFLRFADGPEEYNQPIEAFAWLGGGYFSSRSDFPARIGQRLAEVNEALGTPLGTFDLGKRGESLTVQQHPGDTYSILRDDVAVGFVAGSMPEDPENEQWRALLQMYERYTKPR